MANLSPQLTGLPMIVWISEWARGRHDVRVKVSLVHGRRARPEQNVVMPMRPDINVVAGGELDQRDLTRVRQWIELNHDAISAHWNGDLLTDEVIEQLKTLS